MRNKSPHRLDCLSVLLSALVFACSSVSAVAADLGVPSLSEPKQQLKFFDVERFSIDNSTSTVKPLLEPQLSVSHDARENDVGGGITQTTHRVHGEAGGKLNVIGDVSLITVAKIPVYTHETSVSTRTAEGATNKELFKNSGRLSWRSELGVPLKEGVNLNFFYDNSTFGKVDRPGVDEREEKYGTRFIFKFK